MSRKLRIGVSGSMFPEDRARPVFNGRALLFVEQSMCAWLQAPGVVVYVLTETARYDEVAEDLDALVLTGGVDISPTRYGESARNPAWAGDERRDAYELALFGAMLAADKPILGICRGHQLINVALGGTLHQDIREDRADARVHRDAALYDLNQHEIELAPGGALAKLYPNVSRARVNTVHHQAVRTLGNGLVVEAICPDDGIVEAVSLPSKNFVRGVQWHPEFRAPTEDALDNDVIRAAFFEAARSR